MLPSPEDGRPTAASRGPTFGEHGGGSSSLSPSPSPWQRLRDLTQSVNLLDCQTVLAEPPKRATGKPDDSCLSSLERSGGLQARGWSCRHERSRSGGRRVELADDKDKKVRDCWKLGTSAPATDPRADAALVGTRPDWSSCHHARAYIIGTSIRHGKWESCFSIFPHQPSCHPFLFHSFS